MNNNPIPDPPYALARSLEISESDNSLIFFFFSSAHKFNAERESSTMREDTKHIKDE